MPGCDRATARLTPTWKVFFGKYWVYSANGIVWGWCAQIVGLKEWVPIDERAEAAEHQYRAEGWSRPRRIVVLRFRVQDRPEGQKLLEVPAYTYAVYVTNLRLSAIHVRQ